jgi:hypothetical protein
MKTTTTRVRRTAGETARYFFMAHRSQSINLEILRNELNKACANGTKPDLETMQEARDIIEILLQETPEKIVYSHTLTTYEVIK